MQECCSCAVRGLQLRCTTVALQLEMRTGRCGLLLWERRTLLPRVSSTCCVYAHR